MSQASRKPSQIFRTQNETNKKAITFPKRVRINNQRHPKPNSQESDLERHEYHEIYPLFLTRHCRNLKELTLVRILTPHLLLLGSHLQTSEWVGFKVVHIALISARIWQDFPLFLLSPWLFKGITGRSLLENPLRSHQLEGAFNGGPSWSVDMRHSSWCGRIFTKLSRTLFFPLSQLIASETLISGPVLWWWTPRRVKQGRPRYCFSFKALELLQL